MNSPLLVPNNVLLRHIFDDQVIADLNRNFSRESLSYRDHQNNNLIAFCIKNQRTYRAVFKNIVYLQGAGLDLFEKNDLAQSPIDLFYAKNFNFAHNVPNEFERIRELLSVSPEIDINKIVLFKDRENLLTLFSRVKNYHYNSVSSQWRDNYFKWLIDRKINLNFVNRFNYSALDIALLQKNMIIADFILKHVQKLNTSILINSLKYADSQTAAQIESVLINDKINKSISKQVPQFRKNKI